MRHPHKSSLINFCIWVENIITCLIFFFWNDHLPREICLGTKHISMVCTITKSHSRGDKKKRMRFHILFSYRLKIYRILLFKFFEFGDQVNHAIGVSPLVVVPVQGFYVAFT